MKEKMVNKLTYEEKIIMLYNYADENVAIEKLAKKLSGILYKSIKLNNNLCIEIADNILNKHAIIRPKIFRPSKETQAFEHYYKKAIISFTPNQAAFDKVEFLTKYINHEMSKYEQNTCKYVIK